MYDTLRSFVEAADESPLAVGDRWVRGSDILVALGSGLNGTTSASFDDALQGLLDGDVSPLLASADGWYGRGSDGTYDDDIVDAKLAISALDAPFPGGRADVDAFVAAEVLPESVLFAPQLAEVERTFVDWPFVLPRPLPTVHAPRARPVLILAGDGDPATPASWSEEMRDALANGSSVVTHGAPVHGQLFASQCVRDLAVPFLIDPNDLPAETYCPPDPEE